MYGGLPFHLKYRRDLAKLSRSHPIIDLYEKAIAHVDIATRQPLSPAAT